MSKLINTAICWSIVTVICVIGIVTIERPTLLATSFFFLASGAVISACKAVNLFIRICEERETVLREIDNPVVRDLVTNAFRASIIFLAVFAVGEAHASSRHHHHSNWRPYSAYGSDLPLLIGGSERTKPTGEVRWKKRKLHARRTNRAVPVPPRASVLNAPSAPVAGFYDYGQLRLDVINRCWADVDAFIKFKEGNPQ